MAQQFYEKALPSQGVYCVTGIKDGKATNRFAETLGDMLEIIDELKESESNVFFALNSYQNYSRKADNAAYCKSLFIDLDVGEDSKKYTTKDEALAALDDFIKISKLPPPVRVDSGGGVHAYWIFDQDIPSVEWKDYSLAFKKFCLDYIKIDPAVMGDTARVMRCPDTVNYKRSQGVETALLDEVINVYSWEKFKEFIGPVEQTTESVLSSIAKGLDSDTEIIAKLAKFDNYEYTFKTIAVQSLNDKGCAQIKNVLVNARTLPEPLWRAGLSVAVRCVDGPDAIHTMSKPHPQYDAKQTEAKAQSTLKATSAYGCEVFNQLNPGVCDGCPHRGKIYGPIELGREFKPAPTLEEASAEDAVRGQENPEEVPLFPSAILPYVRGRDGGVFYLQKGKVNEEGEKEPDTLIRITNHDFFPVKRMTGATEGESLLMRHIMPKDPVKEFVFPVKYAYAFEKMKELLSFNGVNFMPAMAKYVSEYIIKWDEYMQLQKAAEVMRQQMGWTENSEGFVAGTLEILINGDSRPAATSPLAKNVSKFIKQEGDYEIWKKSANAFNHVGLELHAMGLLAGFGSPLMSLTNTPGCTISYVSPESGVGKTGSMYAGVSVFGNPFYLSVSEGNATDNALLGRYLSLKNIMFGLDEASNINSDILSRLIHRISQGRAKLRMQSSINAEREIEFAASLIAVMTTNQSLYDKLSMLKGSPDGEMARIIEFRLEKPEWFKEDPTISKKIVDPFNYNYGHAGPEFIRAVYKLGLPRVREIITDWSDKFRASYGTDTAYRFYENTVACSFAGGEIACAAGIIDLDLQRIFDVVLEEMNKSRRTIFSLNSTDYKELLALFFNHNHKNYLIFNEDRVVQEPYGNIIVGRIDADENMHYVSKSEMRKFLAQPGLQISARAAEEEWRKNGLLVDQKKQRLTTGWKQGTHMSAVSCYVFKSELPENFFDAKGT